MDKDKHFFRVTSYQTDEVLPADASYQMEEDTLSFHVTSHRMEEDKLCIHATSYRTEKDKPSF